MFEQFQYRQLIVQSLPSAGLIVRFARSHLITTEHVQEARRELLTLVAPERLLLFDLTNLEHINSPVIETLVFAQRAIKRVAGSISLCGLRPEFEEVFRVLRLDQTFEIYTDLESALGGEPESR